METLKVQDRLQLNGLDFKVEKRPVYLKGKNEVDGIPVIGDEIDNYFATVRTDTDQVLGIVKDRYKVIQNAEALGIVDFFDGELHKSREIDNGRQISVSLDIGNLDIGGDDLKKRFHVRTSHDGSCGLEVKFQVFRMVCKNGLFGWRDKSAVSIRHTESYKEKISEARRVLDIAEEYYKRLELAFNRMIETPLTHQDRENILDKLIGKKSDTAQKDRITPIRDRINIVLATSRDLQNHLNNAWGFYNAIAAYVDHDRIKTSADEKRYVSQTWGSGSELKQKAFEILSKS